MLPIRTSLVCLRLTAIAAVLCLPALLSMSSSSTSAQKTASLIAPETNEAKLAIAGFRLPEGMTASLFAAEPDVANIVTFSINRQGRVYVCETFRQQHGVEDNRYHMDWLEDDLSLTSVEQRREMFEKFLGDKLVDYTKYEDRIRLLEDTNGDGRADASTVFADGFNDVLDGTGAGVLQVGDDIWYTCIPHVWRLKDTDGDGVSDEREALSSGYGIRVAFRGHDMHGLVRGPDGRVYFSIGDRGFNVTTKEGRHLFQPDNGAVLRCEPDGSNLEVFAHGLRNPQELAFDDHGNLFSVDNNSDGGDQARFVYIAQHGDSGWRMYYQYLPDRGPWSRERMWYPYRGDDDTTAVQPAYIVPAIVNVSDGPSGFVAYPGLGLPSRYDGHFFLADFRGTAANSGIRSFTTKPNGATFEIDDSHEFLWSILATDVDFGYDGKMYISDWVDGWDGIGKGRLYTFEFEQHASEMASHNVAELMSAGFNQRTDDELVDLLQHPDRRIRQEAQFALVEHNAVDVLSDVVKSRDHELARLHALWGLGQLARHDAGLVDRLVGLLDHADPEIQTQTLKLLGDVAGVVPTKPLLTRLDDGTPRQQYFAAMALGKSASNETAPSLFKLLKTNNNTDPLLRHAAVTALAHIAQQHGTAFLTRQEKSSAAERLGIVLVLRRLADPALAASLEDVEPSIVLEAARAIHDLGIEVAMPALANVPISKETPDALVRRIMNAQFRLGSAAHAKQIAQLAANRQWPEEWRLEAANMLADWDHPAVLDRVTNEHRPLSRNAEGIAKAAAVALVPQLLGETGSLQEAGVRLAGLYAVASSIPALNALVTRSEAEPTVRTRALVALDQLVDPQLRTAIDSSLTSDVPELRIEARRLLAKYDPQSAVAKLNTAIAGGETNAEKQQAIDVLATVDNPTAEATLAEWLDHLVAGNVSPAIQLDLINAANTKGGRLAKQSAAFESKLKAQGPFNEYEVTLEGGNASRGYDIFFGRADASCRRCHKVNGDGSDVGPDLSAVAKENSRDYLLESIINPNAKIAKGFETVVFLMDDGRVQTGLIRGETDETYRLMQPKGEMIVIRKDEIDEQAKGQSGMPSDLTKSLSKSDIRDLVEYLSTLKTPFAAKGHE